MIYFSDFDDGGDPDFSTVKLLIGADTSVTDESLSAHTLTTVGNAARTTANSKFGAGSLVFDGTGDRITAADSADWNFGTSDFTVEGWFRFQVKQTNQAMYGHWTGTDNSWFLYINGSTLTFTVSSDGGSLVTATASFTPTLGTWYHIAADRDAAKKCRLYVDGTMVGSNTMNFTIKNATTQLSIGAIGVANAFPTFDFNGNMDELRVSKGLARYASDAGYTVPTAAFPRS